MKQALFVLCIVGSIPVAAGAEGIWQWSHEASGSGTANLFDGGPPVFREDETDGPDDDRMSFVALDRSIQPGTLAADAVAQGASRIIEASEDRFRLRVDLLVGYFPSGFPGGDNPAGMAEGELTSVVEFTMPVDELSWFYSLDIDNMNPAQFDGSTNVIVENVTQGSIIVELTSNILHVETTLGAT